MHIAIFTDSYFPYVSGVTIAVRSQISEFLRKGHRVSLFVSKRSPKGTNIHKTILQHPRLQIYEIGPSINLKRYLDFCIAFPNFRKVLRILKKDKPDVIHIHTELSLGYCGKQVAQSLNIPLVGTFHTNFSDPQYLKVLGIFRGRIMRFAVKKYQKRFFSMCDVLVVPSSYTYRELTGELFHPNIVKISSGIEIPHLLSKSKINNYRKLYQLDKTTNVIVVGRLSREKNIESIIRAFAIVNKRLPNTRLIIIGDGTYTKTLKNIAYSLKLHSVVHFFGMIPHEQIIQKNLVRLGDVFVTTSTTETLGLTTLEAMAQKVLTVGAPEKGLSDILTTKTAILCHPRKIKSISSKIIYALNMNNRQSLIREAYTLAQSHSKTRVAVKLISIYQSLLNVD